MSRDVVPPQQALIATHPQTPEEPYNQRQIKHDSDPLTPREFTNSTSLFRNPCVNSVSNLEALPSTPIVTSGRHKHYIMPGIGKRAFQPVKGSSELLLFPISFIYIFFLLF
jgi:hypothetical protein